MKNHEGIILSIILFLIVAECLILWMFDGFSLFSVLAVATQIVYLLEKYTEFKRKQIRADRGIENYE